MARLQYADPNDLEIRPLVDRIVAERGGVLHLYQMLLHSPPVAEGWLALMTAVRQKSALAGAIRELVIMRIAIVNGAPYEAEQHAPIALKEGLKQVQLDALADWSTSDRFSDDERAVLALADGMTRDVHIDETLFEAVRPHFSAREIVELVVTIASYNMVSRVLEALQINSADAQHDFRHDAGSTAGDCGGGLTRVNYFHGELLGVDEFLTEQHYLRARLRRHNRYLLGSGVASGLAVLLGRGGDGQTLTIDAGLAIDARGEEIEVASAVVLPLPAKGKQLLVQVTYAERLCRPVPAPAVSGDTPASQPSRIEETFRAFVAADAKPAAVPLARLSFVRGRWSLDRTFMVPRTRNKAITK